MDRKQSINIILGSEDRTGRGFDNVRKKLRGLDDDTRRFSLSWRQIGTFAAGFAGASAIDSVVRESIKGFAAQEDALQKLEDAAVARGNRADLDLKRVERFAAEIQRLTPIADDAAIGLQTMGVNIGRLTGDRLERATRAAIGLSNALVGIDAQTAMMLVSRAAVGQTSALSRYGIVVDTTKNKQQQFNEILAQGEAHFRAYTQRTRTTTEGWQQLQNAVGDIGETLVSIGMGERPGDGFSKAAEGVTQLNNALGQTAERMEELNRHGWKDWVFRPFSTSFNVANEFRRRAFTPQETAPDEAVRMIIDRRRETGEMSNRPALTYWRTVAGRQIGMAFAEGFIDASRAIDRHVNDRLPKIVRDGMGRLKEIGDSVREGLTNQNLERLRIEVLEQQATAGDRLAEAEIRRHRAAEATKATEKELLKIINNQLIASDQRLRAQRQLDTLRSARHRIAEGFNIPMPRPDDMLPRLEETRFRTFAGHNQNTFPTLGQSPAAAAQQQLTQQVTKLTNTAQQQTQTQNQMLQAIQTIAQKLGMGPQLVLGGNIPRQ